MKFDVFISHASEDKEAVARPLADLLVAAGISVWLDERELTLGDSLRRQIDEGLAQSRYGLVILSPAFFKKEWPNKELDGLVAREDGREKVILPVWHRVERNDVVQFSAPLADKLAATTKNGLDHIVSKVQQALAKGSLRSTDAWAPPASSASSKSARPSRAERQLVVAPPLGIDDLMVGLLDRVVQLHEHGAMSVTGVRTGFSDLDQMTAGLQPGDLIVLAARPSVGKTALALNIVEHVATVEGLPALVFTLEMRAEDLTNRIVASLARIDHFHLRIGALRDEEWLRFSEVAEKLGTTDIYVDETPHISVSQLCKVARFQKGVSGAIGLIVIDCLQLLKGMTSSANSSVVEHCLAELKRLARELDCPVVLLSSLPRGVESRADKRPVMSDFPNSEAIEQYADVVLFLYRDEHYTGEHSKQAGVAEVIIARQRRGPLGTIRLSFLRPYARFEDLLPRRHKEVAASAP
jgi:hypothetical protein